MSPMVNVGVAWGLYVTRDFQGASEQCWKVLAMEPKFGAAQYTLGLAYAQMGLTEDAIVELQNARTCSGDQPAVLAALAHLSRLRRRIQRGRRNTRPTGGLVATSVCLAVLVEPWFTSGLGDQTRALDLLDQAYRDRDVWMTWLGVEPRFDALRGEPRFQQLLRGVGLVGGA